MINYQYQIVRYLHDRRTEEFVNVGLVLYEPVTGFLDCKVLNKVNRLSSFFGGLSVQFLQGSLLHFESMIKSFAKNLPTHERPSDIASITSTIIPNDDSALTLTAAQFGVDVKPNLAFEDLFDRLINKYVNDVEKEIQTDEKAWRRVYKQYFDKVGVTDKLKKHEVKTDNDIFKFSQAWKNGVWNCYQPLAFDLKSEESIKSKVYKWSGIISELEKSAEPFNLYLLATTPDSRTDLEALIKKTLKDQVKNQVNIKLVTEDKAEQFAHDVRKEMEKHNVISKN
jgi:hypothetical protein